MFKKILIANRGEIAVRVIRTARQMGIATVAVYSDADADAMHVAEADEAVQIGAAAAAESYLRINRVIQAAKRCGAEAIHPGYGFLSENAEFARAIADEGLVFIGPPATAIDAMGQKAKAKALMQQAKVPVVPGYHGNNQDPEYLSRHAADIGYPLLIKAVAGGGGKGMRRVERPDEFDAALASAQREAKAAFGNDQVLLERYVAKPRHIEVQVFADSHGEAVHLFERDCSLQRRHQKVIEEAPAPDMPADMRDRMGKAAVDAAKAIGYVGAGTVEFIANCSEGLRSDRFYFMEMNTRLQVEHPVTEMITGQDLVSWQLLVAAGGALPLGQDDLAINGHALEARIYAEVPERNFMPSTGQLLRLRPPTPGPALRIDTGVREGDAVSIHYDPMIAKLITWGEDRKAAITAMELALGRYEIAGIGHNLNFLGRVCRHVAFIEGDVHTGFIDQHSDTLLTPPAVDVSSALLAALMVHLDNRKRRFPPPAADPASPWDALGGWRLNDLPMETLTFTHNEEELSVILRERGNSGYLIETDGRHFGVHLQDITDGRVTLTIDGHRQTVTVVAAGTDYHVIVSAATERFQFVDPVGFASLEDEGTGSVNAPLPGKIIQVLAKAGDAVKRGDSLLILEAMKMEHTITAPADGVVANIDYVAGDQVQEGDLLVAFETEG